VCRCGKKGCYEAYISNFGIVNGVKQLCAEGKWRCSDPESLSYEEVLNGAQTGDPVLVEIFTSAGLYLGLALSGMIQIFNPAKIIVTGNGIQAAELVFDTMYKTLKESTAPDLYATTEVTVSPWQDIDWALGGACLVLQELYKSPLDRCIAAEKMQEVLNKS